MAIGVPVAHVAGRDLRVTPIPALSSDASPTGGHVPTVEADVRDIIVEVRESTGFICVKAGEGPYAWRDFERVTLGQASLGANALTILRYRNAPILVTGGRDGDVRSYDLSSGHKGPWEISFPEEILALESLAIAGSPCLLAGGVGGLLSLYDLSTGEAKELVGHSKPVYDITLIEHTDRPIAITVAGSIRVWDLVAGEQIIASLGSAHTVTAVRQDGRQYLLAGMDDGIYVTEITELIKPVEPWEHAGFSIDTAAGPARDI